MTWCAECVEEGLELLPVEVKGFSGKLRRVLLCPECKKKRERQQVRRSRTEAELEEERRLDARLEERQRSRSVAVVKGPVEDKSSVHERSVAPSMDTYQYVTSRGTEGYRLAFAGWKYAE